MGSSGARTSSMSSFCGNFEEQSFPVHLKLVDLPVARGENTSTEAYLDSLLKAIGHPPFVSVTEKAESHTCEPQHDLCRHPDNCSNQPGNQADRLHSETVQPSPASVLSTSIPCGDHQTDSGRTFHTQSSPVPDHQTPVTCRSAALAFRYPSSSRPITLDLPLPPPPPPPPSSALPRFVSHTRAS